MALRPIDSAMDWRFQESPDLAVIIKRRIVQNGDWIAYVSHDIHDGGWQFHDSDRRRPRESDALVLSLREVAELDPSIVELADLPVGWHAWRSSNGSPWSRGKT